MANDEQRRTRSMKRPFRFGACLVAMATAWVFAVSADVARTTYALQGARIFTVSGAAIQSGTLVMRNGLIEAVGADVQAPADAVVVDGAGMNVYPGLIDMGNGSDTDIQVNLQQAQQGARTTDEAERMKRALILRPHRLAADTV